MSEWRPIEMAPHGTVVIIGGGEYPVSDYVEFGYKDIRGRWFVVNNGDYVDGGHGRDYECVKNPAHEDQYAIPSGWMPMPEPPEEGR